MSGLRIETFKADMTPEAARMLARAFSTNPLHVAAFGTDALAKNEALFRAGLTVMKGRSLVALEGPRILGLTHWVDAPRCHDRGSGARRSQRPDVSTGQAHLDLLSISGRRINAWLVGG